VFIAYFLNSKSERTKEIIREVISTQSIFSFENGLVIVSLMSWYCVVKMHIYIPVKRYFQKDGNNE